MIFFYCWVITDDRLLSFVLFFNNSLFTSRTVDVYLAIHQYKETVMLTL